MIRTLLSDDQWERIAPLIPGKPGDPGRHGADNRGFVEATLWIARTGSPWRDLPSEFGNWNTAFQRFRRWATRAFMRVYSKRCPMIQISNTSWSTARSSGSINMEPAQKGDSKSGDRAISRGPDDQNHGSGRCTWQSRALHSIARATT